MNRLFVIAVLLSLFTHAQAQDETKNFELIAPAFKVPNSLYNTVEIIDGRTDPSQIGIVQVGLLKNRDARLVCKIPLPVQVQNLVSSLIDSTAKDGRLLFQLLQFNFVENTGTRYCYLKANLYRQEGSQYKKITAVDSTIIVTVNDVPTFLSKQASSILAGVIAKALVATAAESVNYSRYELNKIDSIEKIHIPVFNTTSYADGLYNNFNSFFSQVPDKQGFVDIDKSGTISSIKVLDETGKKTKIKPGAIYGLVYKGVAYAATEYGYYALLKIDDDFIFTGDVRIAASTKDVRSGQFAFGILGGVLAKSGNRETFQLKIDPADGKFIHLRRVIINTE